LKQKAFLGSFVYALKQSRQFDLSALSTISLETVLDPGGPVLVPPGSIMIASALVLVVAAFVRLAMTFGIMAVMAARSI
jgi:hypothetical protein